jgi:hypothetical protein
LRQIDTAAPSAPTMESMREMLSLADFSLKELMLFQVNFVFALAKKAFDAAARFAYW